MRRSGKNTHGFIKVSLIFIITLILSACSLGCESTVPTVIPPVTSEPSSSLTAHPERLRDEVLLLVKDYLMECAETSLARDIVWMEVASLDATYQDDVGWLVSGNGEWIVHDVTGSVEPADENALRILQSIIDANKSESPSMVNAVSEVVSSVVQVSTHAGSGSGVIIDQAGYVLTNNHVVAGTLLVTITLPGGEQCGGIVVGRDEIMDIAIVQAAANNLQAASFGDSSKLMVGEKVVSMGFPLSLGGVFLLLRE
ncbi:MAG: trypsin-like peptidase domain-containing protein [Dehalococcoidia bacterium]|nr:trypsin-like peptidase domain-containing protein [Dehalococcoidia bacterium]